MWRWVINNIIIWWFFPEFWRSDKKCGWFSALIYGLNLSLMLFKIRRAERYFVNDLYEFEPQCVFVSDESTLTASAYKRSSNVYRNTVKRRQQFSWLVCLIMFIIHNIFSFTGAVEVIRYRTRWAGLYIIIRTSSQNLTRFCLNTSHRRLACRWKGNMKISLKNIYSRL